VFPVIAQAMCANDDALIELAMHGSSDVQHLLQGLELPTLPTFLQLDEQQRVRRQQQHGQQHDEREPFCRMLRLVYERQLRGEGQAVDAADLVARHALQQKPACLDWACAMAPLGAWSVVLGHPMLPPAAAAQLLQLAADLPRPERPSRQQLAQAVDQQAGHVLSCSLSERDGRADVLSHLLYGSGNLYGVQHWRLCLTRALLNSACRLAAVRVHPCDGGERAVHYEWHAAVVRSLAEASAQHSSIVGAAIANVAEAVATGVAEDRAGCASACGVLLRAVLVSSDCHLLAAAVRAIHLALGMGLVVVDLSVDTAVQLLGKVAAEDLRRACAIVWRMLQSARDRREVLSRLLLPVRQESMRFLLKCCRWHSHEGDRGEDVDYVNSADVLNMVFTSAPPLLSLSDQDAELASAIVGVLGPIVADQVYDDESNSVQRTPEQELLRMAVPFAGVAAVNMMMDLDLLSCEQLLEWLSMNQRDSSSLAKLNWNSNIMQLLLSNMRGSIGTLKACCESGGVVEEMITCCVSLFALRWLRMHGTCAGSNMVQTVILLLQHGMVKDACLVSDLEQALRHGGLPG
jgi:hypothetical protein